MSDYFSVLKGTVDNLRPNTRDTRRAIYERARNALFERLTGQEPRLPKRVIESEQAALEAAIGRLEDGYGASARPRAPEVPAAIASVLSQNRGPSRPAGHAPAAAAPVPEVEPDYARSIKLPSERPIGLYAALAAVALLLIGGAAFMFWPKASFEQRAAASAGAGAGAAANKPAWSDAGVNYVYLRQPVYYRTTHPVGTIVVDKAQRLLYVVRPNVVAIRYGIGVGPDCVTAAGLYRIARKEEWPGLKDPKAVSEDRAASPLGARALYLDQSYRLHGTNAPNTIGSTVSLGCFRLTNDDIVEIYQQAPVDTRVVVTD